MKSNGPEKNSGQGRLRNHRNQANNVDDISPSATFVGRFQCDSCGRVTRATEDMIGRRVRCRCGHMFRVQADALMPLSIDGAGEKSPPANGHRAPVREAMPVPVIETQSDDVERVEAVRKAYQAITAQLSQVIVGQQNVIEEVLISMFCRGHVLLVGVPGLAKTLLVSSVANVLDLQFHRIQFTPDLMPADITGTEVLQEDRTTGKRNFQFVEGPVFSNMVLADEINRAPPKTQAALLEAMQERHVTVGDQTRALPAPFFVMATQNPIEQEGTYPLPEAQLDRFLFNIVVDYPTPADEFAVIKQATSDVEPNLQEVLNAQQILDVQQTVRRIPVADHVIGYARDLVHATRPNQPNAPDFVRELVGWGAGPRAGISLVMAAKARAVLYGRFHATTEDVRKVAAPVLRHRVVTTFNAEAAGVRRDNVIEMLLKHVQPVIPTTEDPRTPYKVTR